jgi:hypothetical protein
VRTFAPTLSQAVERLVDLARNAAS